MSAPTFRIVPHSTRAGESIVEILLDGLVVGALYAGPERVRLVSAHFGNVWLDTGEADMPPIPALIVPFDPKPYRIEGGKLVREWPQ